MNRGNVFWGLLLVVFGVMLFLSNLGVVNWSFWHSLLRYWPVLLIFWGLLILTGRTSVSTWLILLMIIAVLVGGVLIVSYIEYKTDVDSLISGEEILPIGQEIERGRVGLDLGGGKLSLVGGLDRTFAVSFIDSNFRPKIYHESKGNLVDFKLEQQSSLFSNIQSKTLLREWEFKLPQGIQWDLDLDMGAVKADLDFRKIDLKQLNIDMGAGDLLIQLGDRGLETEININAGASKVKIIVPENMELKIKMDGGLNTTNIKEIGLTKMGDYYQTEGISSSSKLKLVFDGGVSKFDIIRYSAKEII